MAESAASTRVLSRISRLPLGVLHTFGRGIAGLLLLLGGARFGQTIRRNLQLAFPDWSPAQLRQIERQALRNQILALFDFLRAWGNPPAESIQRIVRVERAELLSQALAHPKGCLAIVPHYGSWEIMNPWLCQQAAPVIMYKPDDNPSINAFVLAARSRLNAALVPTNEQGVRQIFKALKQGGFSIVLPDHIPEASGGIQSAFFAVPALTGTLASKLIQKTQCAVVLLTCVRCDDDAQQFEIQVDPIDAAIYSPDLQTSVDALNLAIETRIRQAPEHYHWGYKRFKASPHLQDYYHVDDEKAAQIRQNARSANQRPQP